MKKIVLDTNVWLSAIFWKGEANKVIELAEQRKFELAISREILSEIVSVLNSEAKFQKFIQDRAQNTENLVRTILSMATLVSTKTKINIIEEHPADNIILEAATDSKADYIVSYDKHILNLREFRGIEVLKPGELLKFFR